MKKFWMKTVITLTALKLLCAPCFASIPRPNYGVDYYRTMPRDSSVLVQPMESLRGSIAREFTLVAPSDLSANDMSSEDRDRGNQAGARILGRSLQKFLDNSSIGKTAHRLEQAVAVDQKLGNANEGMQHSFKFKLQAERARAELAYQGLLNAQLTYRMSEEELRFEVREKVASATDLVLSHTDDRVEARDMLSLSFNF